MAAHCRPPAFLMLDYCPVHQPGCTVSALGRLAGRSGHRKFTKLLVGKSQQKEVERGILEEEERICDEFVWHPEEKNCQQHDGIVH